MDELKLSIIIPLFNGKQFIQKTVEGLLGIKCKKEILIIDDGSNDGSYEYCYGRWKSNPDIKIFSKKNSGIVDTRNFGIEKAKGKYLLFSDHDDVVYPDVVDEAVQKAEEKRLDGMIWSTVRLLDGKRIVPCDIVQENYIAFKDEINNVFIPSMLMNMENKRVSYLGHVWAGIYSRNLIEEKCIRFKRYIDIEDDYLFVFDFLNIASGVGLIDKAGYAWRFNQKSETYRLKYIDNILARYQEFYSYLERSVKDNGISDNLLGHFKEYKIQNTVVMAVENSFTYLNQSKDDKNEIKDFYKRNRSYFKSKSFYNYEKRRKRIYLCLHYGLFGLAGFYIYLDSFYRKIKSNTK